jgi:ubiquinone/menaquinone biosynthesis C-methylase UbiE
MLKDTQRKVYEHTYSEDLESLPETSHLPDIRLIEDKKAARCYELLATGKDTLVLDIGCGNGIKSLKYLKKGASVVGFDISESGAKAARKRTSKHKNTNFLVADAEHMPFKPSCFDVVSCIAVIEHVEDQNKLVSEISRTLKEEGNMIIQTPNKKNSFTVDGTLRKFFPRYYKRRNEAVGHSYDKFLNLDDLRKICLNNRLEINCISYTETFIGWIWTQGFLPKLMQLGSTNVRSGNKVKESYIFENSGDMQSRSIITSIKFYNNVVFPLVYYISIIDIIIEHWGYSGGFTVVGSKH